MSNSRDIPKRKVINIKKYLKRIEKKKRQDSINRLLRYADKLGW